MAFCFDFLDFADNIAHTRIVKDILQHDVAPVANEILLKHIQSDIYGVYLKKESLKTTKDENDYAKSIAEKTKQIGELQAKIDKLSLDDSREAKAERASLVSQLADLQKELGDLQGDHAYDSQVDALDKLGESYEEGRQSEIDDLEASISSAEKLYQAAIERLSNNWDALYQELIDWNTEAGSSLNSEITENWQKAAEAVGQYGSYLEAIAALDIATTQDESDNTNVVVSVDDLPKYHSGGVVDDRASLNESEAVAVLEKGEIVLDSKKKLGLYKLIDFQQVLSEKLGTIIGNIGSPIVQMNAALAGVNADGALGGNEIGRITFSPSFKVEIYHSGNMDEKDATSYGEKIADTAIDKLYEAFERRGRSGIFGAKLKQ